MTSIKAILYDLDGVLVDACEWHYKALNDALQAISGVSISRQDHNTTFNGLPTNRKLKILLEKGEILNKDIDKIWKMKQDLTVKVIKEGAFEDQYKIRLHEWTKKNGIEIACVTNSIKLTANLMLECTGQISYMKFVLSNEDVEISKPHPMPYLRAMEKLNLKPKEVLIIEDSEKGFESAVKSKGWSIRVKDSYEVTQKFIEEKIKLIEANI